MAEEKAPEKAVEEKKVETKAATEKKAAPKKAPAKKAAPKKAAAKKAPAKKAAPKKAAAKKAPAKKAAPKKAAAKKAPAKKAAPKKAAAKKAPAKKAPAKKAAPAKAPEVKKSETGVYVVRTAQKVTDSLPKPLASKNEGIMRAVTTGVDFVEEFTKNAMANATVYVDLGKQQVTKRRDAVSGAVKKVTDTCTVAALEYNEKYVKKALDSGKKTFETGTDLVEDFGMVALETIGTAAESGKKLVTGLPMADKVEGAVTNGKAMVEVLASRKEVQAVTGRVKSFTSRVASLASK